MRADGEANEIVRVGHRINFVKIIDTPNQSAFEVAPRPEILDVQIADGQHARRLGLIGADFLPKLHPAVKRGAEEEKWRLGHPPVLQLQIRLDDLSPRRLPLVEALRSLNNIQARLAPCSVCFESRPNSKASGLKTRATFALPICLVRPCNFVSIRNSSVLCF